MTNIKSEISATTKKNPGKLKSYTTDNRVIHKAKDEDIIQKIGKVLGKKFFDYRKEWDAVNRLEIVDSLESLLLVYISIMAFSILSAMYIANKKEKALAP